MKYILFTFILVTRSAFAASPVWLVESDHYKIYLAGTIHLLRSSDYPLPDAFELAYQQSQSLAFETDIGGSNSPAFQSQLMKAVSLPQNQSLKDIISAETFAELESHFAKNHLSVNQFIKFKPSMVAISLTLLELEKLGVSNYGVDQYFFNLAQQDMKKTLALESLQQQIDFIANMGKGQEDQMIRQTLEDIETMRELFSDMLTSWKTGDIQQLEEMFILPMQQEFDTLYQQLLVQRNLNWLPQIYDYLKTPETEMVLVGSAHLLGKDGLINHLKQAGYRVTQLE